MWTCAKGVYAEPVAEHALTLALAGMRGLHRYARARTWSPPMGDNLLSAKVTILGGGGITESLVRLLGSFDADVTDKFAMKRKSSSGTTGKGNTGKGNTGTGKGSATGTGKGNDTGLERPD